MVIMDKVNEIMSILQEECGELIVAISKCERFGLEENKTKLIQECGDVMAMIELLEEHQVFNKFDLTMASVRKRKKLKEWSNIFTSEATSSYRERKEIAE